MAFNIFKKKAKAKEGEKPQVVRKETSVAAIKVGVSGFSSRILSRPHITEKAAILNEHNQYVFEIFPEATKPQVKKAVEETYGVLVTHVRITKTHSKKVRIGKTIGVKQGVKKAIVRVKEGQKIELLPR